MLSTWRGNMRHRNTHAPPLRLCTARIKHRGEEDWLPRPGVIMLPIVIDPLLLKLDLVHNHLIGTVGVAADINQ